MTTVNEAKLHQLEIPRQSWFQLPFKRFNVSEIKKRKKDRQKERNNKRVRRTQSNNLHNQLHYDVPPRYFGLYKPIIREVVYNGTRTQQILLNMYMRFL
jgi:hypothetical protein